MGKSTDSSNRVISFVLTVAFGLLILVVGYAMLKGGVFQLRSKAATEETIIKEWTFDTSAETWTPTQLGSAQVINGNYKLTIANAATYSQTEDVCTGGGKKKGPEKCRSKKVTHDMAPRIAESSASGIVFNAPAHEFRMHMTIAPPAGPPPPATPTPTPICEMPPPCAFLPSSCDYKVPGVTYCPNTTVPTPTDTIEPTPVPTSHFPIVVSYKLAGKSSYEAPVTIDAIADSTAHQYTFAFPAGVSLKTLSDMVVSFASMRQYAGYRIWVVDISIVGVRTFTPTSTPAPSNATVTYTGDVYTSGEGTGSYRLSVAGGGNIVDTFQVLQAQGTSNCPSGATCNAIDLSTFVGKHVTASGTIVYGASGTLPVFYAQTMQQAN